MRRHVTCRKVKEDHMTCRKVKEDHMTCRKVKEDHMTCRKVKEDHVICHVTCLGASEDYTSQDATWNQVRYNTWSQRRLEMRRQIATKSTITKEVLSGGSCTRSREYNSLYCTNRTSLENSFYARDSVYIHESHGSYWNVIEGNGRSWKATEGNGKL